MLETWSGLAPLWVFGCSLTESQTGWGGGSAPQVFFFIKINIWWRRPPVWSTAVSVRLSAQTQFSQPASRCHCSSCISVVQRLTKVRFRHQQQTGVRFLELFLYLLDSFDEKKLTICYSLLSMNNFKCLETLNLLHLCLLSTE